MYICIYAAFVWESAEDARFEAPPDEDNERRVWHSLTHSLALSTTIMASSSPPRATPRAVKRPRSPSRSHVADVSNAAATTTPTRAGRLQRRASGSSLPPSSPPAPFLDTDEIDVSDQDALQDIDDERDDGEDQDAEGEDDEEGEDLFGETLLE